ncbi:ribosome 60S biogenesis N-terminal-domain-containing protein [Coniella lustricola]|uniref:Ribosome 60S biogenesis N-terminal-domain-containing protein n=1 Tax=Coniella lustricola TaxID=2025994 RepID=A0A2T3AKU9_9PEZI|nr:ribosome 60S biogenesis N-terminal-domain-containing protein [Coniella lustricola]
MGKRNSRGADANPRKRQKIVHEAPTSEEIHTSRQLQQLLSFEQDLQKARHGLQSFKVFLDRILAEDGASDDQVQILRGYIESTKRQDGEFETTYFPDIMETWSYAAHTNNDNIMSAVVVILALLLKFVSQRLELTADGLGIGRTILQKRHQELLARNLSMDKSKEFIISPTLRLLREVICLDGGSLAKPVFRARNLTFKSLARNMGIRYLGEGVEDVKRPSARTNAIRVFLSALKFLHTEAKVELLSQKEIPLALTKSLRDDPPSLIIEILDTLRNHVLKDEKLPAQVKGKLLNSMALSRFASLYHYEHNSAKENAKITVEDAVHAFLTTACTSPTAGILRSQTGYYPRHVDPDDIALPSTEDEVEPGLESITWMNEFKEDVPVRNVLLADFIKSLKPHSSLKQSELLLAIFDAAPELVAKYFIQKQSFTFDPKLSATWIGYSAFLYKAIQQPIPDFFGHKNSYARVPPPTSILIDNILPLPLSRKIIVKCLAQKSELVPFIVTRLLVIAMQKLETALRFHKEAMSTKNRSMWSESARRLIDEFCQRAPGTKEVISCYRGIGAMDLLQREAASRLLRLYYEVIPQVALMAKFDVSPYLVQAIKSLDMEQESDEDRNLRLVELEHLLAIAGYSPGMRWFAKSQGLPVSPYVALLKVLVTAPAGVSLEGLRTSLAAVAEEHQLTQPVSGNASPLLDALQSIKGSTQLSTSEAFWLLIDNSASRCATAPIKYLEMGQEFSSNPTGSEAAASTVVSPFALAFAEQLPFTISAATDNDLALLAQFVATYLTQLKSEARHENLITRLRERIELAFEAKPSAAKLLKKFMKKSHVSRELQSWGADFSAGNNDKTPSPTTKHDGACLSLNELNEILHVPWTGDPDASVLSRWAHKEADELIEEGYAASVVSLLGSEHISIRKEALVTLSKMAIKIRESSYEEKEQVWLLFSELVESCKVRVDSAPVANAIVAFARHALVALKDPLHCMYGKVNTFLLKGPTWKLDRLPLVHDILQEGPELDDTFYAELGWLFSYLLESLQTEADVSVYHNIRLFERLLSLLSNPYMRQSLRISALKIIYRTTCIKGGSTTLITRFGIVSWLEAQQAAPGQGPSSDLYKALLQRVWSTADQERANEWSRGGINDVLQRM